MSRRNARLAIIHDLQCKQSDCTLTKKDLVWIVTSLRQMDKTNFSERDLIEYNLLETYLSHLTYGKQN